MAVLKNNSNLSQTVSWRDKIKNGKINQEYTHITVEAGKTVNDIPFDVAIRAITAKEPRWLNVWLPGDKATYDEVVKLQPGIPMPPIGGVKDAKTK